MKSIFLLLIPICSFGQAKLLPRIEHDTLYMKNGYKWYPGLKIHFARGSAPGHEFRFIRQYAGSRAIPFDSSDWKITKIEKLAVSGLENVYVYLDAEGSTTLTGKDGLLFFGNKKPTLYKRGYKINFEKAVQDSDGSPAEITIPEEFKVSANVSDELSKLAKLYRDSVITKDEFEAQKKKILSK